MSDYDYHDDCEYLYGGRPIPRNEMGLLGWVYALGFVVWDWLFGDLDDDDIAEMRIW